jgi:hypothetical protein
MQHRLHLDDGAPATERGVAQPQVEECEHVLTPCLTEPS